MAVIENVEHGTCAVCGADTRIWITRALNGVELNRRTEHLSAEDRVGVICLGARTQRSNTPDLKRNPAARQ